MSVVGSCSLGKYLYFNNRWGRQGGREGGGSVGDIGKGSLGKEGLVVVKSLFLMLYLVVKDRSYFWFES